MVPRWPHNSKDHVHIADSRKEGCQEQKDGTPGGARSPHTFMENFPLHLNDHIYLQEKIHMKIPNWPLIKAGHKKEGENK